MQMLEEFLIAIDQVFNTLLYIPGDSTGFADETLSARAWRLRKISSVYKVIDAVFFWSKNHCQTSYLAEKVRLHEPKEYRE